MSGPSSIRQPPPPLDKGRIEAFSDGVFAIAITLLVLELHLPEHLTHQALPHALKELAPKVGAYALSFVIIGVYWVAHHVMLASLRHSDRILLWLNNLLLLFVAAIPFSASVLGNYPREPLAATVYGANLVATNTSLLMLWLYATAGGRLLQPDTHPDLTRVGTTRTVAALLLYLAAIGLSWVDTRLSIAIYWAVPLAYIFLQALVDLRIRLQSSRMARQARSAPAVATTDMTSE